MNAIVCIKLNAKNQSGKTIMILTLCGNEKVCCISYHTADMNFGYICRGEIFLKSSRYICF